MNGQIHLYVLATSQQLRGAECNLSSLVGDHAHEPIHASLRRQQNRIKLILAILLIVLPAMGGEGMAIGILDGADDTQNSNGDIGVDI